MLGIDDHIKLQDKEYGITPAELDELPYCRAKVLFSRPLFCGTSDKEILAAVGDKILSRESTLTKLYNDSRVGGTGLPGKPVKLQLSANKRELTIAIRWDVFSDAEGKFYYTEENLSYNLDTQLTFCAGLTYGLTGNEKLDEDIVIAWDAKKATWTVLDQNAEPDYTGVKIGVSMTDADGGPGMTEREGKSISCLVFSERLFVEDTSAAALMARFGPHILINGKQADSLSGVVLSLNEEQKILTITCDGKTVIDSGKTNRIVLSKALPITSQKTLERDVAFEYTTDAGAWAVTDPYTGQSGTDASSTPSDTSSDGGQENPGTGATAPIAAIVVLAAAGGAAIVSARRKHFG